MQGATELDLLPLEAIATESSAGALIVGATGGRLTILGFTEGEGEDEGSDEKSGFDSELKEGDEFVVETVIGVAVFVV